MSFPGFLIYFNQRLYCYPKAHLNSLTKPLDFYMGQEGPQNPKTTLRHRKLCSLTFNSTTGLHKFTRLYIPHSPWCKGEILSCTSSSLLAIMYYSVPLKATTFMNSPVVLITLKVWHQCRHHFKFLVASTVAPACKNHFLPLHFPHWQRNGIKNVWDLCVDWVFCSFAHLTTTYGLPASNLFRYLQIKHCSSTTFHIFPSLPSKKP